MSLLFPTVAEFFQLLHARNVARIQSHSLCPGYPLPAWPCLLPSLSAERRSPVPFFRFASINIGTECLSSFFSSPLFFLLKSQVGKAEDVAQLVECVSSMHA